jgi:predicted RNA methylase
MRVSPDVIAVLDRCTFDGSSLTLPGQLDRQDYVAVNKVIEAAGGKWNRKAKAHLFDEPAADTIERVILAGEVVSAKQALGYFPTPPRVVAEVISLADLYDGLRVLEPSAGDGALVDAVAPLTGHVDAIEIDEKRAGHLISQGIASSVAQADFLTVAPDEPYGRVVMNPPFAKQADVDHVMHALGFLTPGGRLVSVMAIGVTFRQIRKADDFRKLVADRGGFFEELPDDAFKASGTGIKTVIAVIPGGQS